MLFTEALTHRGTRIKECAAVGCQYERRFCFLGTEILATSVKYILIVINRNYRGMFEASDELFGYGMGKYFPFHINVSEGAEQLFLGLRCREERGRSRMYRVSGFDGR